VTELPTYTGDDVPRGLTTQLVRFAAVGVASTLAYLALFVLLRGPLGAQGANFAALLLTAIANTAVNRRVTFGVRGAVDRFRHQLQGLLVFAVGLGLTAASLALLTALAPDAQRWVEVGVLVAANITATLVRFLLFRSWVFPRRGSTRTSADALPLPAGPDPRTTR
jgi:putative flippase GtrA